jgi:hypothetical protein
LPRGYFAKLIDEWAFEFHRELSPLVRFLDWEVREVGELGKKYQVGSI